MQLASRISTRLGVAAATALLALTMLAVGQSLASSDSGIGHADQTVDARSGGHRPRAT